MNVLVIDDSSVMRKMIMRALRQGDLNANVGAEAGNGLEGLDALKSQAFDLVLCDWNMPVMDGLTFVAEARKSSEVPIIMLTTESGEDKMAAAVDAGANGYITKPFTPEKLGERIKIVTAA